MTTTNSAASASEPSVQDEREAFEAWMRRTHTRPGTHYETSHNGVYKDNRVAAKWAAWKAGRASLAAQPSPVVPSVPGPLSLIEWLTERRDNCRMFIKNTGGPGWREDEAYFSAAVAALAARPPATTPHPADPPAGDAQGAVPEAGAWRKFGDRCDAAPALDGIAPDLYYCPKTGKLASPATMKRAAPPGTWEPVYFATTIRAAIATPPEEKEAREGSR